MKKVLIIVFTGALFLSLIPNIVQAGDAEWCRDIPPEDLKGGLVPCGRSCDDPSTSEDETEPCQLCHFFVMFDRWVDRLLFIFVPVLAALMIAIGGFMYIFAYTGGLVDIGGDKKGPALLSQAKKLFTSVAVGLLIIYGAFLIIGIFLSFIGLAEWTTDIYQSWWKEGLFEIPCP